MQHPTHPSLIQADSELKRSAQLALLGVSFRFNQKRRETFVNTAVDNVLRCYREPWRNYHDTFHPLEMLAQALRINAEAETIGFKVDWLALRVMIIYHDAILKLMREKGWNERESAKLAFETLLSLGAPLDFCHFVAMGIRATTTHEIPGQFVMNEVAWNTVGLLLDLDLEGLGRDEGYFARNTEANWLEWQPVATRAEYDAGRAQWAGNFLDTRTSIYQTRFFRVNEEQAKANLRRLAGR